MKSTHTISTEIESAIESYVQGGLTEAEIEELWTELIQNREYLDYLKTYAALSSLGNCNHLNQNGRYFSSENSC